jgi:hypothetical protein
VQRIARLLPALWAGVLLCVALLAAPATFAMLDQADAGRVVGRMFVGEAYLSLLCSVLVVLLERRRVRTFNAPMLLALGALFCTVAGYFALQPMMAAARLGQGNWSFGQLHAVSLAFYGLKTVLVLVLAWRAAGGELRAPTS